MNRPPASPTRARTRPGEARRTTSSPSVPGTDGPRVPRTVEARVARSRRETPRWVGGALAGVQGALLSFLVLAIPALAAYVATSADPTNADVPWPRAVGVGSALWLMGHGAPVEVDGVRVTLVPLGITLLALFGAAASARRSAHPSGPAWLGGVGGHAAVVLVVALPLLRSGTLPADPLAVGRLLLGTAVVAGLGVGWGLVGGQGVRTATRPVWGRVPALVRAGVTAGGLASTLLVGTAALVTAEWVVSRRAPAGDVIAGLGLDTFGGAIMAAAQLAVAPNLVLWVLAWLVGPGFAVGAGTSFAPGGVVGGPLPALPMLAALPESGSGGGVLAWVPVSAVAAGVVAGWWLHRRVVVRRAREPVLLALTAAVAAGVVAGLLALVSGGGVGPGRLAVVGGPVLLVAGATTGLVLLGALVTVVPLSPRVRAAAVARVSRARSRAH